MHPDTWKRSTFVYGLVDPRDDSIFYVGISVYPHYRFKQHRSDRCSAAWGRMREIEAAGWECELELIAEYQDRQDAWDHESELIASLPNLLNRDYRVYKVYRRAA